MKNDRIKQANAAFDALKLRNFEGATDAEVRAAAKGIYYDERVETESIEHLLDDLKDAAKCGDTLGIHRDSVTAHQNYAAAKHGLRIKDILAMKEDDTVELIVFCRNVGDKVDGTAKGHRWNSLLLEGLKVTTLYSPAKYTHKAGMRGDLDFKDGCVHKDFEWELNVARAPFESRRGYWSPLNYQYPEGLEQDHPAEAVLTWNMFDPNTRVGWRGPMVRVTDLAEFPVQHVTHYDNFWNDYGVVEHRDWTDCK